MSHVLTARAALVDGRWREQVALTVHNGHIAGIQPLPAGHPPADDLLVPAFANVHSHAFQWDLRGDTHRLHPDRAEDDFWSWRQAMYARAARLDAPTVQRIATELYRTLRSLGWSAVAEFHYLHHENAEQAPGASIAMALAHARAAESAGIRLTLVPVAYHRAGAGRPPEGAQRRFSFGEVGAFLRYVDALDEALAPRGVVVGVGAHSVRAVPASWLRPIADWARSHRRPLHIHVAEQRRELEECRLEHGCSPIALLDREGFLGRDTVLVHATHLSDADVERIASSGSTVCVCPSTERDLGDGLVRAQDLLHAGVPLCVGTDSHTEVCARQELALLELHERLRIERRNALAWPARERWRPAESLVEAGAVHGMRALGRAPATLLPGTSADFLRIRPGRVFRDPADALDRWLLAAAGGALIQTWVDGVPDRAAPGE